MRTSRRFLPEASALEGRVVLSRVAAAMGHVSAAEVRSARPAAGGNVTLLPWGPDVEPLIQEGATVYEKLTTRYYDGLTRVGSETIVPDGADTQIVTQSVLLPGSQGTESFVDVVTSSGNTVAHHWTTVEPDKSIRTEDRTDVALGGGKILRQGVIHRPDGVVMTYTGTVSEGRNGATTSLTYTESNGITYHDRVVAVGGPVATASTETIQWSDGSSEVLKSSETSVVSTSPIA